MERIEEINAKLRTREELEAIFGQGWDTKKLAEDFILIGINCKLLRARSKADSTEHLLRVQGKPRLYFDFRRERGCVG